MWAFELFLLIVLVAVVVLVMRGGKPVAPDNPLIVQRPGQLHITLAPQLNRAQTFIENIAKQCGRVGNPVGDVPTQFFEVRDSAVIAQGEHGYLLAASWRAGIWFFQAINPQPLLGDRDSRLNMLREFSEAVLLHHPLVEPLDDRYVQSLRHAVENAALLFKIDVRILQ